MLSRDGGKVKRGLLQVGLGDEFANESVDLIRGFSVQQGSNILSEKSGQASCGRGSGCIGRMIANKARVCYLCFTAGVDPFLSINIFSSSAIMIESARRPCRLQL